MELTMRLISPLLFVLMLWPMAGAIAQTAHDRSVIIVPDESSPPDESNQTSKPTTSLKLPEGESRLDNSAGLKLEFAAGNDFSVGSKLTFKISTEQPGYLVLVDVDSEGKLTQIYPNVYSPQGATDSLATINLLKPGRTMTVPDPTSEASFEFVASPPRGVGMVVAMLSDKPVQVIDLPDVPPGMTGQRAADEYLRSATRSLKILPDGDTGQLQDPKWSFATKFYSIH
jgi:hypothetical protein